MKLINDFKFLAGDDPSERNQDNSDRIKRRTEQIDHVFAEITKVTQAAVDRYVDGILLNTIYKKAGQKADVVMQEKVRKLRRSSTSDLGENLYSSMENLMDKGGTGSGNSTDNLKIKRRIKDLCENSQGEVQSLWQSGQLQQT